MDPLREIKLRKPNWRIYSLGEDKNAERTLRFFCGIERRTGGALFVGRGKTYRAAVRDAVVLASPRIAQGGENAG